MSRAAIISNGRLAVGINTNGFVHDFYYPYVGQENLTTARSSHHKIGVTIDGQFSWLSGGEWEKDTRMRDDFMGSNSVFRNSKYNIEIETIDFVDFEYDAFCRIFKVVNNSDQKVNIKLFLHQVFQISNDGRADTAMYVPNQDYILDYKGRTTLLINGRINETGESFDQYAVGSYEKDGKAGTFADAEDGELSGNGIEHGGVDSVMRFSLEIESKKQMRTEYWVVAGDSQYKCEKANRQLSEGLVPRLNANFLYWDGWLSVSKEKLNGLTSEKRSLVTKSLLVIKAHCDARGGIIASLDSSIYNYGKDYYTYVWPRDGAYAIWPLIRLGYYEEAKEFFNFCRDIILDEGFLMHKFQPDRAVGSTWHPLAHQWGEELPIQEDETAGVLFMIGEFYKYSNDLSFVRTMYDSFVVQAANFLSAFIDKDTSLPHASYDLWEEKFLTTTYTASVTYAALLASADIADLMERPDHAERWRNAASLLTQNFENLINPDNGSLIKGYLNNPLTGETEKDLTLDTSSVFGCMIYNYYPKDSDVLKTTFTEIEKTLAKDTYLIPRYKNDGYFKQDEAGENPWIVCTLWIAQYYIRLGDIKKAEEYISAVENLAYSGGMFPEQIDAKTKRPISVAPLVWSHAEYINTLLDLKSKK